MKQMIKNHREIETLEDFIYYDKASGKIKIKKQLDLTFSTGAISQVIGLNSSGNLVKGTVSGGTQLYKHTLSSWTGSMLTEHVPLVIISTSNTPFTIDSLAQMVSGIMPDFRIINIFAGDNGVKAVALSMGGYVPGGFTRLSLYYQYANDGNLTSSSKVIVEDAIGTVTGFTDTVTTL